MDENTTESNAARLDSTNDTSNRATNAAGNENAGGAAGNKNAGDAAGNENAGDVVGKRDARRERPASPPLPSGRPGPGSRRELGIVNGAIEAIGARATGRKRLGVFATIGRAKRLFRGWLIYSATMMPFGDLSRQDTELCILRVAFLRGADYERDHHRVIGRRAGLSKEEIAAVDSWDHGFTGQRGAMLAVVDELVQNRDCGDEAWAGLDPHFSEREKVALVQLTTHYDGLATSLHVLGTPADEQRR